MKPLRLLLVSYWSLGEPLTASMVLPYLRLLAARPDVEHIRFVTIGSSVDRPSALPPAIPKVSHTAVRPLAAIPHLFAKALLSLRTAAALSRLIRRERIDLVLAATSMAGAPVHAACRRTGVPYSVYCFEPHADYMVECGVWAPRGVKYRFAHHMERVQMANAERILTVTENYRRDLVAQGQDLDRFRTMPCVIDTDAFGFSAEARTRIRSELGIPPSSTVGVYVGKFGGLYYDEEAFHVFRAALDRFTDPHVLVLSPMDVGTIRSKATNAGIPEARFHVRSVPHTEVPWYLSAADFAFSTVRPGPSKRYQCPVKNGEYWAAGLPILMSDGIGDDHLLMRKGIGGAVFGAALTDLDQAFDRITGMLARPGVRGEMHAIALRTRSLSLAHDALDELIDHHHASSGGVP